MHLHAILPRLSPHVQHRDIDRKAEAKRVVIVLGTHTLFALKCWIKQGHAAQG